MESLLQAVAEFATDMEDEASAIESDEAYAAGLLYRRARELRLLLECEKGRQQIAEGKCIEAGELFKQIKDEQIITKDEVGDLPKGILS